MSNSIRFQPIHPAETCVDLQLPFLTNQWTKFIRNSNTFILATRQSKSKPNVHAAQLLNVIGNEAQDAIYTLGFKILLILMK